MPVEAELSPKAAARVAREAATQSFDNAARALNIDWGTNYDGKQIERWGEARGEALIARRDKELAGFKKGDLPVARPNEHELAAHEHVLALLDKASGGQTVWRRL